MWFLSVADVSKYGVVALLLRTLALDVTTTTTMMMVYAQVTPSPAITTKPTNGPRVPTDGGRDRPLRDRNRVFSAAPTTRTPVVLSATTPVTHAPNPPRKPRPNNRGPTKPPVLPTSLSLEACNGVTAKAIFPGTSTLDAVLLSSPLLPFPNCPSTVPGDTPTIINFDRRALLFTVFGTGSQMTASTYNAYTNLDTQVSVYEFNGGACPGVCVAAGDDSPINDSTRSIVPWLSKKDQLYVILVNSFFTTGSRAQGPIQLDIY